MASAAPPPPVWTAPPGAAAAASLQPAGFWQRFLAHLIDWLIIAIPVAIVISVMVGAFGAMVDGKEETMVGAALLGLLVAFIGIWLYEALFHSSASGATPGKRMVGVRVLDDNGARLTFGRATGRFFAKAFITHMVPLAFGYIMAAFTERKRALHDMIASTIVVKNDPAYRPAAPALSAPQAPPAIAAPRVAAALPPPSQGSSVMSNVPNTGPAAPPPPVWDASSGGPGAPTGATGYGGFWLRVVAYIIDAILLNIASTVISLVVGGGSMLMPDPTVDDIDFTGQGITLVIGWLYFALLESSERGATVGKMAVGLRVVTDQGKRLGFGHATGRYFAKIISAIILGIGFIMVAFTERKRGLHDMIAGTLVVKTR